MQEGRTRQQSEDRKSTRMDISAQRNNTKKVKYLCRKERPFIKSGCHESEQKVLERQGNAKEKA